MNASTMSRPRAKTGRGWVKGGRRIWGLMTYRQSSRTYYPDEPTKSTPRVLVELLWWLLRSGEINNNYYAYGLDRKTVDRSKEVLPYRQFRRLRDTKNMRITDRSYNYVCVLRDKFVFSQFADSLGIPTPRTMALLDAERVTWLDSNVTVPLRAIAERSDVIFDGFCKPLGGTQGDGAFALRIEAGSLYARDRRISVSELRDRLDDRYVLQERIRQHEIVSALHPNSVNTVRLVTFVNGSTIELFSAAMRIGTRGRNVDNWAAGGVIVGIDAEHGELRGEAFHKPGYGGRVQRHPDSGIAFDGFEIPYFAESVMLVSRLHGYLRDIHSVGWDVAITPEGPTIIEGNDDWEGGIPMVLERDFRRRFLEMLQLNS
jgi:hypothetical protein